MREREGGIPPSLFLLENSYLHVRYFFAGLIATVVSSQFILSQVKCREFPTFAEAFSAIMSTTPKHGLS